MKAYTPPPGSIPRLPVPDLAGIHAPHLVGIGGAGMSGIARVLLDRGIPVSGCDLKASAETERLAAGGAAVVVGHSPEHLDGVDAVIVSTAIPAANPEVKAARERGIPVLARAQVLAALMAERRGVAVAGTHGKTTTTSMLAAILMRAGLDPTYLIGGDLNESGSNARSGGGDLVLAEADESDGSFLLLRPEIAIVTNVEADHLDFYADREEVEAAFIAFGKLSGTVVACADDPGAARVLETSGAPGRTYGQAEGADVRIVKATWDSAGGRCTLLIGGDRVDVRVPLPGTHYLLNAAAAIATADLLGVRPIDAAETLRSFGGVRRRFEKRGSAAGVTFIDDYAHHPTELTATIDAARAADGGRLVAVFQPHRYSRTAAMGRELGESLAGADVVVVTDVYGAGEAPVPGVTGKAVLDALVEAVPGKRAIYLPRRSEVAAFLAGEVRRGDTVLTLGAGDITMVGDETLLRLTGGTPGG